MSETIILGLVKKFVYEIIVCYCLKTFPKTQHDRSRVVYPNSFVRNILCTLYFILITILQSNAISSIIFKVKHGKIILRGLYKSEFHISKENSEMMSEFL